MTIKGRPMVTQWEQTQNESRGCTVTKTTWTNDEVPGGVVRSRTDTACGPRTMVQDKWLDSYAGTRTRPAAARPASPPSAAAPSSPTLPTVDRLAQRNTRMPTAISTSSDDQIVQTQLGGGVLDRDRGFDRSASGTGWSNRSCEG